MRAAGSNRLVAVGVTDKASIDDVIWPAFQRDVDPAAEIDYAQVVAGGRILTQVRELQPGERPDVVVLLSPGAFIEAELAEPFEVTLRDRYPAPWVAGNDVLGPLYMEPIVAISNARYAEAPSRWSDLADPAWTDRVVLEDPALMLTAGPALAELSSDLGRDAWETLLAGLAQARPRLVADNERCTLEVAMGSRWMGLSNLRFARRVRAGSPVRHVFLDPTPCVPAFGLLVHGARNPVLGRRFLAWLTSENGQRAWDDAGRIACLPEIGRPALAELAGGVRPLFGSADWVTNPARWADDFRSTFAGGGRLPGQRS